MSVRLPRVVADTPLNATIEDLLRSQVEILPWSVAEAGSDEPVGGIYTYGHVMVDGAMLDRLPGLRVISNYGVGVDHIDMEAAATHGIPVGNTPGVLEGATADLGFALLMTSARRIIAGDRYAHSAEFLRYDPGYMLGREVHGNTLGIIGMGRIGHQVARRAIGFDMTVLYHNRSRREDTERALAPLVYYAEKDDLLARSDYVMLCVPLTDQTRNSIDAYGELCLMKPDATLINIARGAVVDTEALTEAGYRFGISHCRCGPRRDRARAPLPQRPLPLLSLPNVIITPHLGSAATVEDAPERMAEQRSPSRTCLAGLRGELLPHPGYLASTVNGITRIR